MTVPSAHIFIEESVCLNYTQFYMFTYRVNTEIICYLLYSTLTNFHFISLLGTSVVWQLTTEYSNKFASNDPCCKSFHWDSKLLAARKDKKSKRQRYLCVTRNGARLRCIGIDLYIVLYYSLIILIAIYTETIGSYIWQEYHDLYTYRWLCC